MSTALTRTASSTCGRQKSNFKFPFSYQSLPWPSRILPEPEVAPIRFENRVALLTETLLEAGADPRIKAREPLRCANADAPRSERNEGGKMGAAYLPGAVFTDPRIRVVSGRPFVQDSSPLPWERCRRGAAFAQASRLNAPRVPSVPESPPAAAWLRDEL